MYKVPKMHKSKIQGIATTEGETIETKVQRITENKEPISDGSELVYTDRKDGVLPAYDIRTDRWDVAVDAMDKVSKSHQAKRDERIKEKAKKAEENGKPKPIQGTEQP